MTYLAHGFYVPDGYDITIDPYAIAEKVAAELEERNDTYGSAKVTVDYSHSLRRTEFVITIARKKED